MPSRPLANLPRPRHSRAIMTTHRFTATVWHNVLGTLPPSLTIASGDGVVTETLDAAGFEGGVDKEA